MTTSAHGGREGEPTGFSGRMRGWRMMGQWREGGRRRRHENCNPQRWATRAFPQQEQRWEWEGKARWEAH